MRAFSTAICAAVLVTATSLFAEQSQRSTHEAKPVHSHKVQHHVRPTTSRDRNPFPSEQVPANGVVIYNGNQRQTRVFNASTDPVAPVQNLTPAVIRIVDAQSKSQPVVVRIASAESSAQPVVVGVVSSGFQTAGAVQPVATGVSPRPAKRPPYRPAALDRQ